DPADFPVAFGRRVASHVRCGRRLCRADSARDALSPVAQCRHNFVTQALPEVESGVEDNRAIDALRDNTRTPPPEQAAFRIDDRAEFVHCQLRLAAGSPPLEPGERESLWRRCQALLDRNDCWQGRPPESSWHRGLLTLRVPVRRRRPAAEAITWADALLFALAG